MDWTQFTFLAGTVVAMILKVLVFKDDTAKRDKVLPVLVLFSNFLARLIQELAGANPEPLGAQVTGTVLLAGFWDAGFGSVLRLVGVAAYDTLLSMGLHRAKRWRDAMVAKPKRRR